MEAENKLIVEVLELRNYIKENNLLSLTTEVEKELNDAIVGFRNYWLNIILEPTSWEWNNGDNTEHGRRTNMLANINKTKSYSDEFIKAYRYYIDFTIGKMLKSFIDSITKGRKECNILHFYVDYDAYKDLGEIVRKINSVEVNIFTFPCKTQSYIEIKNIEVKDGVIVKANINAISFQGYRAPLRFINLEGKLVEK